MWENSYLIYHGLSINVVPETEVNNSINFLDLTITKTDNIQYTTLLEKYPNFFLLLQKSGGFQ